MKLQISLSATPILYHITNTRAAASIAQKNRFELKPAEGTEAEEKLQGKAAYYLSTARHKTASYTRQKLGTNSVILVLNGIALSSKYKIAAVDYWADFYRDGEEMNNRDRMEAEDRVLSDTPFIENAGRYITEIHAYRGTEAPEYSRGKADNLVSLYKFGLKNKIPVFFYNDVKPMLLLNKLKAVPLDRETLLQDEPNEKSDYAIRRAEYDFKYRNRLNDIVGWIALYEMKAPADMEDWKATNKLIKQNDRIKMAYDNLRYHHSGDDVRQLNNGMHNEKSTEYGTIPRGREDLDRLVKILRKNKWTVKQFCDHLYNKWYPARS